MTQQYNEAPIVYQGSCLCGAIRYEIRGDIGAILHCHCQRCRKATGTAFATNASVKKTDFYFLSGEDHLKKYVSSATTERYFCADCGSPMIATKADAPDIYRIRLGSLDTPISHRPSMHVFVADQAEWDHITDDLPQFAQFPSS